MPCRHRALWAGPGIALVALATVTVGSVVSTPIAVGQAAPAPMTQTDIPLAEELLRLVNAERQRVNLPPLVLNEQLTTAAQGHAQDMATSGRLSHAGSNGSTMRSRIDATQYDWSTIGENVAFGQPTATAVMTAWMNSPGHRQNILNPAFTELGIGHAVAASRPYWVQTFGRPL
ncbi:CAP domain-containing protein [Nodosilinea sp. LEGE 07088]|uniref:CAP domain-containing protein n=1 Tax=Nodosilinea sp. LEGE 07088 TaxID=2777968 RepID=UPI00187FA572|nr:CAP domain-containing protein [Nodosilinea sp. LEGE 07088]MBE9136252.1 CAP domain-containing protein [Nodosilinea sp. LEGE 07088]